MAKPIPNSVEQHQVRLDVHTCRVFAADGRTSEQATVFCPRREASLAVGECSSCERFGGLHWDPGERRTSLVCRTSALPRAADGAGTPDPLTPVTEVMTTDVLCVRPEVRTDELRDLFLLRRISGMPVVDERGKPLGVVSKTDLLRAQQEADGEIGPARDQHPSNEDIEAGFHVQPETYASAGEIMTPLVLAIHESSNIGQAAALMAYEGVHRLPVTSDGGKVVGVLSALDILRWFGRRSGYIIPPQHPSERLDNGGER